MKPIGTSAVRQRRRGVFATVIACSLALLTAAACSSSGNTTAKTSGAAPGGHSSQSAPPPMVTVTFETDYLPNGKYAPFIYGQDQGYFRQEGINLDLKYGRGSGLTASAVATGNVDIGMVDSGVVATAIGKGEPIKSVGLYLGMNDFAFYVPNDSPIKSIADMKGHSLIAPPGTPQAVVAPAVFKLAGLKDGDVKFLAIAAALGDSSYAKGQGDAIGEAVNFAPIFQKTRPSRELPWVDVGYKMPGFSIVVSTSTLSSEPDVVARFLKAMYRSLVAALDDPTAAAAAYAKSQPTLEQGLVEPEWKLLIPYFCSDAQVAAKVPIGYQEASDWSAGISILQQTGGVPQSVTADSVYTNSLFDQNHVSTQACSSKWGGGSKSSS
ncbi:MAG: hypothetical protein EPN43_02265 [Jatrophihabitans sp.]|nr:MAG: hypothetical protein EPN43_02265 [Jatrophihabitans sp.]